MQLATHRLRLALATAASIVSVLAFAAPTALAFHDRDCSDFPTQAKAQHFFEKHHPRRDPHHLDADHDGIACEDNP